MPLRPHRNLGASAGKRTGREDKIAAIGIRVRHWVSFHGVSINLDPDLKHFAGIVPCGITDQGVTSLADLGRAVDMAALDEALLAAFAVHFGEIQPASEAENRLLRATIAPAS